MPPYSSCGLLSAGVHKRLDFPKGERCRQLALGFSTDNGTRKPLNLKMGSTCQSVLPERFAFMPVGRVMFRACGEDAKGKRHQFSGLHNRRIIHQVEANENRVFDRWVAGP
jgi:hypothetical protein